VRHATIKSNNKTRQAMYV